MKEVCRMETIPAKTIPAKTILVTKYVAEDGTEFDYMAQCEHYEWGQQFIRHRVYQRRIVSSNTYSDPGGEYPAVLYYLEDESDFDFLVSVLKPCETSSWKAEFDQFGPGWYMNWYENIGDNLGINHLVNYLAQEKMLKDTLNNWMIQMRIAMNLPLE